MTHIPALRRGLAVLSLLAKDGPMAAATIAHELNLPRSTTYHLLAEHSAAGFVVHKPDDKKYALGEAVVPLAEAFHRHHPPAVHSG
ncbi:helix-turn-helix domain-containing protein [Lentzea terrae]|uniref:helix-turn-helix domain-containing protein n=1 Tax=Lentzea terrae TaxID=2200761 RepID=UPI000DD3BB85|nr:helix-turn-helix domain-containing protein [Lentzea terrae]